MNTRTRLTTDQKLAGLAMMARGDTLSQVAGHLLTDYGVKVSESWLAKIKTNHRDTIDKMQNTMAEGQAADTEALIKRSRRMINSHMDKAERDSKALEEIDSQFRDGKISVKVYRRKKAGLLKMSVVELIQISKGMYDQTKRDLIPLAPGASSLPPGHDPNPAQLEALLQAIAAGNTVEIQRLIFNPLKREAQHDKSIAIQR